MTINTKQAIQNLRDIKSIHTWSTGADEALDMAVDALKKSTLQGNDLISRQMAIDVVGDWIYNPEDLRYHKDVINSIPAAQPEIIRCKDCKHYLHDEEYGFDWCNRMSGVFRAKPDGFCSWAVMRGGDSR